MKLKERLRNLNCKDDDIFSLCNESNEELFNGKMNELKSDNSELMEYDVIDDKYIEGVGYKIFIQAHKSLMEKFKAGAKKVGGFVTKTYHDVKERSSEAIEEYKQRKELEQRINNKFIDDSVEISLLVPQGDKVKKHKVYAKIDIKESRMVYFPKFSNLTTECFFVDTSKQKYEIEYIEQKPSYSVQLDEQTYPIDCGIIIFRIRNDEKTKSNMVQVIDNSITINDSVITKTKIE